MNSIHSLPFSFFFIDDLLPDCFGQKKGMTFRSLLTDEPITNKITYEGVKQNFQNLHAEFESFDNFYKKIQTITNRDDFLTQQIIGRNKKTHTCGSNYFELVFSQDGRMDVSIIQVDGIKCVLILNVRISRHYDKSDIVIHLKNSTLANRILSALDERRIHKTKSMAEADAAFKNGLIAYQNEILKSINTNEAKFEIVLNTLDSLIFLNKGIEAKKSIFFDKLFDITQELNSAEQKKFEEFVEQQLSSDNIKQHHKVLLQKLWYSDQFDGDDKNNLTTCFNKIKVAKTFARSFLNQAVDMLQDDTFSVSAVMDMYRIFNKIPTSYLYVLQDELSDIDIGDQNVSDISTVSFQKQMALFLDRLIHLKTHNMKNIYPRFKQLCEDCYKGKIEPSQAMNQKEKKSPHSVNNVLYMSMKWLSTDENIGTLAHALMHIAIHGNPSMRSLIDNPQNETILNKPNTLGYHWFNGSINNETLLETVNRLVLTPHQHIKTMLYEKYPFLENCIIQSEQNKNIVNHKLYEIYTALKNHTTEEEFDAIYDELKTLSLNEKKLLRTYCSSEQVKNSEDIDISGYILGSFELMDLENRQKQKQSKTAEKRKETIVTDDEKSINKQMRHHFIEVFNDFLSDIDHEDKKQILKQTLEGLNLSVLNGLKTLPKNDIIGTFIRDYLQEKDTNACAFDVALAPVILKSRETKNIQLFNEIQEFFNHPKCSQSNQKLQKICSVLSQQDLNYAIDKIKTNPTLYTKESLFIGLYKRHADKDFSSVLDIVQQEYALLLAHEREKRLVQFETILEMAMFSSDEKATEYLVSTCQTLSKEDIKFALSERDINIPEKILLQKINNIAGQNTTTQCKKIKAHIDSVRQIMNFQNAFITFTDNYNNQRIKEVLIEKYLQLSASDIEICIDTNRDKPLYATFFEKSLKNKRKNSNLKQQKEGIVDIVKSTVKKLRFHDAIDDFMTASQKNDSEQDVMVEYKDHLQKKVDEQFIEQFLILTKDGQTEVSEMISENQHQPLLSFFLKSMKREQKEPKSKQALQNFLTTFGWMVDFYQVMNTASKTYRDAQHLYQMEPTRITSDGMDVIRMLAKIRIMTLSLDKLSAVLFAELFEKESMVFGEVVKHGFCQAVLKHKENPSERILYAAIIAFAVEMNDNHYNEIIKEQGQDSEAVEMINDLKKYFKCDSLGSLKMKYGLKEYIDRATEFLFKRSAGSKVKNIISFQRSAFQQYLRE